VALLQLELTWLAADCMHVVHTQMVAAAERVRFTRRTPGGGWGRVQLSMEQMPPVLESPNLPLTNCGQMKENRSTWRLVAGWPGLRAAREGA
jgi:hypothetical protein